MNEEQVVQAGTYNLKYVDILKANGEAVDLREQIDSITIYEDIYSPFITGKLTFRDTFDLPSLLGRAGRDLLRFHITNPIVANTNNDLKGTFLIYKAGERELVRDRTQMYNLYFISVEALYDINTQISKKFSGSSDEITKKICQTYLSTTKNVIADQSVENLRYVSNFWSPTKNFEFLSQHSRTASGDTSFLFFENRDGFTFRTISELGKVPIIQSFFASDYSTDISTQSTGDKVGMRFGEVSRNPVKDYRVIHGSFRVKTIYDYMGAQQNGAIASLMTTYDIVKKKIDFPEYRMSTTGILNENSLFRPDVVAAASPVRMSMMKHFSSNSHQQNSTNSGFGQQRIAEMHMLESSKIEIDVYGRTDYTVGKKVFLGVNATKPIDNTTNLSDTEDLNYSGHYLITAIRHTFSRRSHMCTLELSKESTKNK
jgi:hypothetical protein